MYVQYFLRNEDSNIERQDHDSDDDATKLMSDVVVFHFFLFNAKIYYFCNYHGKSVTMATRNNNNVVKHIINSNVSYLSGIIHQLFTLYF